MCLNKWIYVPLLILPFCALVGRSCPPLWRLVMGTPALHRCLRQTCCPPVFEHYLILFWLTPTDWLWIRQPPYPLVSAVKGQPWLRVFFKAFQSNYNSLSLIKLVPPQHSVMFFLATPRLEELLVFVFPQRDIPFCLIVAGRRDHQHEWCCPETKWCREESGKWGWGNNPSTKEPWLWSWALVQRENKKPNYRNIPCCCWSWILLLLLWASEDSFILLLESLQCTVLAFCLVTLFSEFQSAGCAVGSVRLIGG